MESKNIKETIKLLDRSSDSDSSSDSLILKAVKRNVKRRSRTRFKKNRNQCACNRSKSRAIALWLAAILITFWLIALSWLAAILYGEIGRMDLSIRSAIAGSEGVPDALQKCHSLSKDLQNNQTLLFSQLSDVRVQITNFTIQLTNIQQGLHQVQELLHDTPELTNVPKKLKDISSSVATFGSTIQDLRVTVDGLKETETKLQHILQQNITNIKATLDELTKVTQKLTMPTNESKVKTEELSNTISELRNNLSSINITLTAGYQWIRDDQKKDHELLVSLQDTTQNASMKVMSLETECAKVNEQTSIINSVKKLTDEINIVRSVDVNLTSRIVQLEDSYNNLKNSTDKLLTLNSKTQEQDVNATDKNNNNNNEQTITDGLPH
ncbi:TNF receptor-associated factor family protein DDB_G0272098 isoform X2 [Microplitis mediator]|uniref:TNF receptor-associated factor family protein DDB_G0272098 isoform X2 n=1 Tax=Microplitis mediator TaxID=375433 RepID=UPI002552B410|nr:TNF receptor-associated factor family protein DDB_G0272098 isoform X2 [Microplitis mediator]